ncbi:hypothetical protein LG198_02105 [Methylobacillus arboreus]|uniref:hypothetical protein n=1 Tax=Methylobacillus arboreus TaxID=755170 RepID=UPI001E63F76B|nr:hypothetical protein [Methylobacillus arboreus]MCB5189523.1 hypothetical protein [Methylobacillus arboreus]
MDIVLRRRAIFTGLRPFLNDDELLPAIGLWEREYAVQPVFALSGFIAKCCTRPALKAQRGQMLRAVVGAMELPEGQLLPDPGTQLGDEVPRAQRLASPSLSADDKTSMFAILLQAMLSLVEPALQGVIRNRLLQQLGKQKLEGLRQQALHDWLAGHSAMLTHSYSLDLLQLFINQAYVVMCEALGPVKADQLLAQAIRQAEIQGQPLSFRVHDLL